MTKAFKQEYADFWIQPAKGFTKENQSVTEEKIQEIESSLGFELPEEYRMLMQVQNGGYLRKYVIDEDISIESFGRIETLETFSEYLDITCDEDDFEELQNQFEFCNPDRMISFASYYGHGVVCFDYGWLEKEVRKEPKVVVISDDGEDFLHYCIEATFESFQEFIQSFKLQEDGRFWNKTALMIQSNLGFKDFMEILKHEWTTVFTEKTDDNYGWFNFEQYFLGSVPLVMDKKSMKAYCKSSGADEKEMLEWLKNEGETRWISSTFSPNQHQSGTYLHPDCKESNIVIQIDKPWFPKKEMVKALKERMLKNDTLKIKSIQIKNNDSK